MARWSFSTVPREGCALQSQSGSPHMAAPPLTCHGLADPPLEFTSMPWSSMAHWSVSTVPREGCALQRRSGSPHMAAPPWRVTEQWTLYWNSHWCRNHQWPIGQSPQSPGKAVHSRPGVALLTWQPPPDVPRTREPSIGIHTGIVIINGPLVSLHSPQGRLCTLDAEWLSSHGSPPLTCHGLANPPLEFTRELWSSMAHWSVSTVPREGCAL